MRGSRHRPGAARTSDPARRETPSRASPRPRHARATPISLVDGFAAQRAWQTRESAADRAPPRSRTSDLISEPDMGHSSGPDAWIPRPTGGSSADLDSSAPTGFNRVRPGSLTIPAPSDYTPAVSRPVCPTVRSRIRGSAHPRGRRSQSQRRRTRRHHHEPGPYRLLTADRDPPGSRHPRRDVPFARWKRCSI